MCRPCIPLLLALLLPTLSQAAPLDRATLSAVLKEAQEAWKVPGLAVALVQGDTVLLEATGYANNQTQARMTPETICGIGSVTKSMVATTLASLVQQGKVGWDDPIRKHLPWFRLHDPLADREANFRDLLAHRLGLGRHDALWLGTPWTIEESVRRMAHLEPEARFRSSYRYNNLAYLAVGLAISETAQQPWHEVMRSRLHQPLGMTRTVFTRKEALALTDLASPHRADPNGRWNPGEWYNDDQQIRASGSVKTCARDLAAYLRFHLAGGVVDGKPLVERKHLEATYRPQNPMTVLPGRAKYTDTWQTSYALGWMVSDYRGEQLLEHGGAVDGFRAHVFLLPKHQFGVAILTNCTEGNACLAVGQTAIDRFLGGEKQDWHKVLPRSQDLAESTLKARLALWAKQRQPDTKPSRPLEAYTGVYRDPAYGTAEVELKEGKLWLKWSSYREPLEHYHFDTFTLPERSPIATERVEFTLKASAEVGSLRLLGRDFKR